MILVTERFNSHKIWKYFVPRLFPTSYHALCAMHSLSSVHSSRYFFYSKLPREPSGLFPLKYNANRLEIMQFSKVTRLKGVQSRYGPLACLIFEVLLFWKASVARCNYIGHPRTLRVTQCTDTRQPRMQLSTYAESEPSRNLEIPFRIFCG
jgi:hypothetical protein